MLRPTTKREARHCTEERIDATNSVDDGSGWKRDGGGGRLLDLWEGGLSAASGEFTRRESYGRRFAVNDRVTAGTAVHLHHKGAIPIPMYA